MFYARIKHPEGFTEKKLYWNWDAYHHDTFSPDAETLDILGFSVSGKNYHDRKESARNLAIDFSTMVSESADVDLSCAELYYIGQYFSDIGRKYGLLREFRENAIC